MGKIAFAFALCAASAFAATYKDFYRVDDWKDPELTGTAYYVDAYGKVKSWNYQLKPSGSGGYKAAIDDAGDQDANSAYWTAIQASIAAAEAMAEAKLAQEQTDTFAKRLAQLLVTDGFSITDPNGDTRTVRLNAGSLGQALAGSSGSSDPLDAKIDKPFTGHGDGKTIEDDGTHLRLFGSSTATASTDEWWNDYGFFVPFLKGTGNLGWKKYGGFDSSVFDRANPVTSGDAKLLTLKGWYGDSGQCTATLSDMLTKDESQSQINRNNHFLLAQYTAGQVAALHYVPIGDLISAGGAPVDDESITTNSTDGASTQGAVSLYGWNDSDTKSGYIPSKGDSVLKWLDPASMVDNSSLALTTTDGGKVWEVNGAHTYAGNHGRHYFGTGDDSSLGWHELPNVTTNNVVGDELSISSTGDGDQKVFSLRGWPPAIDGVPYAIGAQGGALAYFPLPELLTNGLACVCSNRWEALYDWLGDGSSSDAHGIDFTTEGIGERVHDLGFLKTNDLDNVSLGVSDDGKTQIGGFASAMRCNADLSSMLKDPSGEDAGKHLLLANYDAGGGVRHLHYVSIGEGIKEASGDMVDGVSIVTNEGKIAIFGYGANESKGKFLKHGDETGVEWVDIPTNGVDDASIEVVGGKLQIVGFDPSNNNAVPRVDNGRIVWGGASSATNLYVAGSYIEMADGGGGVVTVSAQSKTLDVITGISFSFNNDNQLVATITKQTIAVLDKASQTSEATATIPLWKQNVVIASEYSTQSHTFKNTTLGGVRTVETLPSQPSQTTVFTATAHSGQ